MNKRKPAAAYFDVRVAEPHAPRLGGGQSAGDGAAIWSGWVFTNETVAVCSAKRIKRRASGECRPHAMCFRGVERV